MTLEFGTLQFKLDEYQDDMETLHEHMEKVFPRLDKFGCSDVTMKHGNYGKSTAQMLFDEVGTLSVVTFSLPEMGPCELYWNVLTYPSGAMSYEAAVISPLPIAGQHTLLIGLVGKILNAGVPYNLGVGYKKFRTFSTLQPLLLAGCQHTGAEMKGSTMYVSYELPF